jgi:ribosome-binding protein aMBF1 (putative translation factor)
MPGFQFLPSIRESETIICPRCHSAQYQRNGTCIKCNTPFELEYLTLPVESLLNGSDPSKDHLARMVGDFLRRLRKRRGLSQSQLAARARGSINRTSLSKGECGHLLLPLYKLLPLAKALGLTAVILRFDGTGIRDARSSKKCR